MTTSSATQLMRTYAAYHRDRRNIATHLVGIPLIVFGIGVLLSHLRFEVGGYMVNGAGVLWVLSTLWYLTRGDLVLGVAVSCVNGALFVLAFPIAQQPHWWAVGVLSFFVGWVFQFVGHFFEGKKPAFVDDLVGLLVGPMFVVGEVLFSLGWGKQMKTDIEASVGPTAARRTS